MRFSAGLNNSSSSSSSSSPPYCYYYHYYYGCKTAFSVLDLLGIESMVEYILKGYSLCLPGIVNCLFTSYQYLVTMIVKFCCCSYLVALTLQQEQDAPSTQSQHSQYESQAAQTPMQQITEADQEWAE